MKKKTNKQILAGVVEGLIVVAVFGAAYAIGINRGEQRFIDSLINNYEKNMGCMVVKSSDKNLGNLIYEIKVECIGD